MNKFHIEIGEPSVVAQGENTGWGNYQFPDICYTKSGSVYVRWAMRPDTVEAFAGKGYGEAVSDDLGRTWREPNEDDILTWGVPLKDGVPQVFERLRKKGIASALVTSAPAFRVTDFLEKSQLTDCFSLVITGDRVNRSKPAPDIFLLAAKELGLQPEECMVAEDSHNGVKAGYNAGMRVAMIPDLQSYTREIAPYVNYPLASLAELPDLFQ